jgi:parallel beta-helix repeat protein
MAVKYYDAQATGANDGSSAANAWTDLQTAFSGISAGDTLYLKKQPSRIGSNGTNANMTVNIASSAGLQTQIIGYGSTIGDGVRFETSDGITVSTDFVFMANIDLLITDNKPRSLSFESDGGVIYNCVQDVAYLYGGGMSVIDGAAIKCWVRSNPGQTGNCAYRVDRSELIDCYGELVGTGGGSPSGAIASVGYRNCRIKGCTFIDKRTSAHNSSSGISLDGMTNSYGPQEISGNTIIDFGGNGFQIDGGVDVGDTAGCTVSRNLIYNCGGYGFALTGTGNSRNNGIYLVGNATGSCTSGAHDGNFAGYYDGVLMTNGVNPFTDYAPNASSGGGALISGTYGFPDITNPNNTTRKQWGSYGANHAEPGGGGVGGGTVGYAL